MRHSKTTPNTKYPNTTIKTFEKIKLVNEMKVIKMVINILHYIYIITNKEKEKNISPNWKWGRMYLFFLLMQCALSKLSQCSQLTFVFLFEKQIRDLIQIDKR